MSSSAPFWAVILCALATGGAVHGHRYWKARKHRKRKAELARMFAPPGPGAPARDPVTLLRGARFDGPDPTGELVDWEPL